MNTLGLIHGESHKDYHSSPAFGAHDLDDLTPHPILFHKKHVTKSIDAGKDSPALSFGRYFHCLALEGESAAAAQYVEAPECDRRTTAGKAAFAAFQLEAAGREIITAEDSALAWRMIDAIREKPSLVALLDPAKGKPEVTFRHQMKHFQLQCRVDWFIEGEKKDVNLKTVEHLSDFDRQFEKYSYYRHAAFYRAVESSVLKLADPRELQMVYLVVEKNEPFQAVIREPDGQSIDLGWREVESDLLKLKACFELNSWPGEPDQPRPVSLPEWKTKGNL